jgi:hypothetical protein
MVFMDPHLRIVFRNSRCSDQLWSIQSSIHLRKTDINKYGSRQNVEVKNADGKKRRRTKRRMGQNVEWKKRRLGQKVEK